VALGGGQVSGREAGRPELFQLVRQRTGRLAGGRRRRSSHSHRRRRRRRRQVRALALRFVVVIAVVLLNGHPHRCLGGRTGSPSGLGPGGLGAGLAPRGCFEFSEGLGDHLEFVIHLGALGRPQHLQVLNGASKVPLRRLPGHARPAMHTSRELGCLRLEPAQPAARLGPPKPRLGVARLGSEHLGGVPLGPDEVPALEAAQRAVVPRGGVGWVPV